MDKDRDAISSMMMMMEGSRPSVQLPEKNNTPKKNTYYSLCFRQEKDLGFYCNILHKVVNFAKTFDEASIQVRQSIWTQFDALMGVQFPRNKDFTFAPLLSCWAKQPNVNLFALELLYVSFVVNTSGNADSNLNPHTESFDENRRKGHPFSPFQTTLPGILNQLTLVNSGFIEWSVLFFVAPSLGIKTRKVEQLPKENNLVHMCLAPYLYIQIRSAIVPKSVGAMDSKSHSQC